MYAFLTFKARLDIDLEQATIAGNLVKVRELVERGANFNKGVLHKACMYGHKDIVLYLLQVIIEVIICIIFNFE